jgi:hypothetical protein
VRAGSNYDRHINRRTGFQNWWRNFFGVQQDGAPDVEAQPGLLSWPTTPRVGKKDIDVMVNDFLNAWLIEGDVRAALSYVSPRSYACFAEESDNPADVDLSMAPRQLMVNLKSTQDALAARGESQKRRMARPPARSDSRKRRRVGSVNITRARDHDA